MEISQPQDGRTLGDATRAPYSATEWDDMFEALFCSGDTENLNAGVLIGFLEGLRVTGAATPVTVHTGAALVKGKWYRNNADLTIAVGNPTVATRTDYIILRSSWAGATAQTIRAVLLQNPVEGTGTPPTLTHTDGTTWEIPLAELDITVGGVITLRDARQPIASLSRFEFIPALTGWNDTDGTLITLSCPDIAGGGLFAAGLVFVDLKDCYGFGTFVARQEDDELKVIPIVIPYASGDLYWTHSKYAPACGEAYWSDAEVNAPLFETTAVAVNEAECLMDVDVVHVSPGDTVRLVFGRIASAPEDTITNSVLFLGWRVI